MEEDGGVGDHEGGAGDAGRFLKRWVRGGSEGDDREMGGGGIFSEVGDGGANFVGARLQIRHDKEGFFALGLINQGRWIPEGLHAVAEVLQAIYQLPGRQEPFIDEQRERSSHGLRLG